MMFGTPEINLHTVVNSSLKLVQNELQGATVYLDQWTSDCIQLTTGIKPFFDLGVLNVHSLSSPSKRDVLVASLLDPSPKQKSTVVVFLHQLLHEAVDLLENLVKVYSSELHLLIFCGYSVDIHAQLTGLTYEQNAYTDFKQKLEAVKSGLEVEIRYFPWMWSSLSSESFILTPHCSMTGFPLDTPMEVPAPGRKEEQERKIISQALVGFASHLGCKLDIFTLGPNSHTIGSEVMKMGIPVSLEGIPPQKTAALILIDRSLDLLSPILHTDSLLDRFLAVLADKQTSSAPRLTELGVQVDCKTHVGILGQDPEDLMAFRRHLMGRAARDGSLYLRKWIREEIRHHGLKSDYKPKPGPPTSQEFLTASRLLSTMPQRSKIQALHALILTAVEALDPENAGGKWEALLSNQNQILLSNSPEELLQYFLDLIQNLAKPNAVFNILDVCSLLIVAYTVMQDNHGESSFTPTEEKLILEALIQAALNSKDGCFLEEKVLLESNLSRQKAALRSNLNERLKRVKKLIASKNQYGQLKNLVSGGIGGHQPLLVSLVSMILENKAIPELHHMTSTFHGLLQGAAGGAGGLLSKGLGRLGIGRQEGAVGNHEIAILFVVGGISLSEIQAVAKEVEEKGKGPWKTRILIGGDSFLPQPLQLVKKVWKAL